MKIPESLKIGGHEYKVIYPHDFTDCVNVNGLTDTEAKQIKIRQMTLGGGPRAESGVAVTLLHEILHAVDHYTGHDVFENEEHVHGIAEGLYQVMKDNKLVFE